MNITHHRVRDRRITQLHAKPRLSPAEHDELRRLERAADYHWRRLPRQIAAIRADLAHLTAYADEIGLGPC